MVQSEGCDGGRLTYFNQRSLYPDGQHFIQSLRCLGRGGRFGRCYHEGLHGTHRYLAITLERNYRSLPQEKN